MESILVVEDTVSLREVLCAVLNAEGYHAQGVSSAESALEAMSGSDFALVLCDLKLPGKTGSISCVKPVSITVQYRQSS